MRIAYGETRVAIVSKRTTIKLPRIHIKMLRQDIKHLWSGGYERPCAGQAPYKSLEGVWSNRFENKWSKKLYEAVVPTRFSVFGAVNIQDTALPIQAFSKNELSFIRNQLTDKIFFSEIHTLSFAENYGMHNGKIKLLDYGSKILAQWIFDHLDLFRNTLDAIQEQRSIL